jgi:hypothetical protein
LDQVDNERSQPAAGAEKRRIPQMALSALRNSGTDKQSSYGSFFPFSFQTFPTFENERDTHKSKKMQHISRLLACFGVLHLCVTLTGNQTGRAVVRDREFDYALLCILSEMRCVFHARLAATLCEERNLS